MFVTGQLEGGGAETHLATIAPALALRGWDTSVFSLSPTRLTRAEYGVEVFCPPQRAQSRKLILRVWRVGAAAWFLLNTLRERRPKVVHFFLPHAYVLGAPVAMLAGVPVRVMSRRSLNAYQRKLPGWRLIERLLHFGIHAALGNSVAVLDELRKEGIRADRLGLIYNGVSLSRFANVSRRAARTRLHVPPDGFTLVLVANLISYKGHADLLNALRDIHSQLPRNWRLLLAGRDDGLGPGLRAMAEKFGLADHIVFLGPRNDVPELLMASDVGLLCSHEEGFSNAILESMAAGLPMIVTDVGGNREAVVDRVTGFVVRPRDPQSLAEAIMHLSRDPDLRARMGEAGRRRVARDFTVDGCVASYDALYRALLEGKRPANVKEVAVPCAASRA